MPREHRVVKSSIRASQHAQVCPGLSDLRGVAAL